MAADASPVMEDSRVFLNGTANNCKAANFGVYCYSNLEATR